MVVLLVIGFVGLALLAVALVFGDWLDGLLPDIELGDGLFSLPVLAGLVAGFGFCGAAISGLTDGQRTASVLGGAVGGIAMAWLALRLTGGLMNMPTDAAIRSSDLIGRSGRVVTAIRQGGLGEVLVSVGGHSVKLAARSDEELEQAIDVVVVDVLSPTSVQVTSAPQFWGGKEDTG